MSQWKNIGPVVALSITAAFAGTGCLAQGEDDEVLNDEIADAEPVADQKETVGEAEQAWFGNFIGCGFPFAGFGGFGHCGVGFPFCGGFAAPFCGGFGACALPFAGAGGCGFGGW